MIVITVLIILVINAIFLTGAEELFYMIKRDDLTSFDMSGNKVRKLEFLMAEALKEEEPYDCVITIGGLQSNHARYSSYCIIGLCVRIQMY